MSIQRKVLDQYGFITSDDLPAVISHDRLVMLQVRCGGKRFTAPAQDVPALIESVEKNGSDYIRDVSLTSSSYHNWNLKYHA